MCKQLELLENKISQNPAIPANSQLRKGKEMEKSFLTLEDCKVLLSALTYQRVQLKRSGDYPEEERDRMVYHNLMYTIHYLAKGGEMVVLND